MRFSSSAGSLQTIRQQSRAPLRPSRASAAVLRPIPRQSPASPVPFRPPRLLRTDRQIRYEMHCAMSRSSPQMGRHTMSSRNAMVAMAIQPLPSPNSRALAQAQLRQARRCHPAPWGSLDLRLTVITQLRTPCLQLKSRLDRVCACWILPSTNVFIQGGTVS